VGTIPKEAVLSIRNTAIAEIIADEHIGGGLGLSLTVLFEICQGEKSPWADYLNSLPLHGEELPIVWDETNDGKEALNILKGTGLQESLCEDKVTQVSSFQSFSFFLSVDLYICTCVY